MPRKRNPPEAAADKHSEGDAAGSDAGGAAGFARQVAGNLRRLRRERAWSLEDLSGRAGVSRAMLSQVETGKTTPTIAVLWKIATGFGVPFTELLREEAHAEVMVLRSAQAVAITSPDKSFRSQPLVPPGSLGGVELYRITLAAGAEQRSPAHAPGTEEVVVVESGRLVVNVGAREAELGPGDSAAFGADVDHGYVAAGGTACVFYDLVRYKPGAPSAAAGGHKTRARTKR